VGKVPGYRSGGPGWIPDATIFSEKWWVWNGVHLVSTIEELLGRKSSGCGVENRDYGHGEQPRCTHNTSLPAKTGTNFADKGRSIGVVHSRTKATEYFLLLTNVSLLDFTFSQRWDYYVLCCPVDSHRRFGRTYCLHIKQRM
jgi:hypothetical protein